jgi:hypothetical protein
MIRKLILPALLVCGFIRADAIFNFDSDSVGTATGFTDTVNGISATFSSFADPFTRACSKRSPARFRRSRARV